MLGRTSRAIKVAVVCLLALGGCALLPTATLRIVNDSESLIAVIQLEPTGRAEVNENAVDEAVEPGGTAEITGITPGIYTLQAFGFEFEEKGAGFTFAENGGVLFLPGSERTWTLRDANKDSGIVGELSAD